MMSNQKEQLPQRIAELKAKHPKVKYHGVYVDLAKMTSVREFRDMIERELKGLDIGLVCLNAG